MPYNLVDDLRQEIEKGRVLVVVGTGVSLAATGGASVASWQGLLKDGVERCQELRGLSTSKADALRADIESGDLTRLLSAASEVRALLGSPDAGEVRRWLRDSVGALRVKNREVLEAIRDLGLPIATTNYDDLLEEVTDLRPITWQEGDRVIRVIEGEEEAIVHLHGHWADLDSVILDRASYDGIRQHDLAQTVLRGLRTFKTLLFIGCGEGLADPNFGALLEWAREVFRDMEGRHYRLCKEDEVDTLRGRHQEDHLLPISYGPSHGDLAGFLRTLRPHKSVKPADKPRLPGRPTRCFGRTDELRDLVEALLLPSPLPVPILGPPGVGKTTLSLEALYEPKVKARFGDRRYFVRCDGAKSKDALVTEIALSLGLESGPDLERRLFQALERCPAVLLLDNAETPWDADTSPVESLLTELSTIPGVVLVASIRGEQRPFGPRWREAIRVGPFGLPAARETFVDIAGAGFQSDPDLDRLLEAVDRLPIAVVLLAHQAEGEPHLAALWKRWQEKRTALLKHAEGKERLTNIEVSLDLSLDGPRMTPEARSLLAVLALLPDGVAHEDIDAVMPGEGSEAAAVLRKVGLAFDQGARLRVLAPVREYVSRQHPSDDEDLTRVVNHYLKLAQKGEVVGWRGGPDAVARLIQELGNLDSIVSIGLKRGDPALAIQAVVALGNFSRLSGGQGSDILKRAMGIAEASGHQDLQVRCLEWLGHIALARSDHDMARARYEEALPLYRSAGPVRGEANCIKYIGNIAFELMDYDTACARYEEALPLYQKIVDKLGEANCIRSLGDIALARANHDEACARYEEAMPLFRELGSVLGEANCFLRLGDIAVVQSDLTAAGISFRKALDLYETVAEPFSIGQARVRLALLEAVGSSGRRSHAHAAREAWESIKRPDLVEGLKREFGADFES
jgi:tetratricopeptide (TPR) repeat protein